LIRLLPALPLAAFALLCAAESPLEQARGLYQRTDYRGALRVLDSSGIPGAPRLLLAGKSHFMLGDHKRAAEELEKAVAADPAGSESYHWLGRAYGRRAETSGFLTAPRWASRCRQAFEKSVALDPRNLAAINDLFEYYLQAPGLLGGGVDKAAALVDKIRPLDAVEHQWALARLAQKRRDFPVAEQHLRRAVELAPREVGRVLDLAQFLAGQGRHKESDEAFRLASEVAPDHPRLLFARASVYVEHKRNLAQARELLELYLNRELTPEDPPREEARRLLRQATGR